MKVITHKKWGNKKIYIPVNLLRFMKGLYEVEINIAENKLTLTPALEEKPNKIYLSIKYQKQQTALYLKKEVIKFLKIGQECNLTFKVDVLEIKF